MSVAHVEARVVPPGVLCSEALWHAGTCVLMPMSTDLFDGARRKLITLVGIMALMCFLIEQYVEPTVQNTRPSLQKVWPNAVILLTSALESLFSMLPTCST